jgi:hypothetical protein
MTRSMSPRTASILSLILVGGTALWAVAPLAIPHKRALPAPTHSPQAPVAQAASFDPAAFREELWPDDSIAAPPAESVVAKSTEPPKPTLELLGLVHGPGSTELRAAFYDIAADQIVVASPGDMVALARVEHIDTTGVALVEGDRHYRMDLPGGPP